MTASGWQAGRGPLRVLPAFLFADRRPAVAIVGGGLMALAGSVLLGLVVSRFATGGFGAADLAQRQPVLVWTAVAIVSPILETLLMAGALELLRRWLPAWQAAIVSALGWGVAHSLSSLPWGFVIWWPFLIFSTLYLTWRPRGFWRAAALVASVHMFQNVGPATLMILR